MRKIPYCLRVNEIDVRIGLKPCSFMIITLVRYTLERVCCVCVKFKCKNTNANTRGSHKTKTLENVRSRSHWQCVVLTVIIIMLLNWLPNWIVVCIFSFSFRLSLHIFWFHIHVLSCPFFSYFSCLIAGLCSSWISLLPQPFIWLGGLPNDETLISEREKEAAKECDFF